VGAEIGIKTADAAMSDDFKKNHETAATLITAGAGLIGGTVAGIKAENRAIRNLEEELISPKPKPAQPQAEATPSNTNDEAIAAALNAEYAPAQAAASEQK
jgi:hypothetical protein